ncbi:MAG: hypothetical protein AAGB16_05125, partial [Pseudomonadota bacterium]
ELLDQKQILQQREAVIKAGGMKTSGSGIDWGERKLDNPEAVLADVAAEVLKLAERCDATENWDMSYLDHNALAKAGYLTHKEEYGGGAFLPVISAETGLPQDYISSGLTSILDIRVFQAAYNKALRDRSYGSRVENKGETFFEYQYPAPLCLDGSAEYDLRTRSREYVSWAREECPSQVEDDLVDLSLEEIPTFRNLYLAVPEQASDCRTLFMNRQEIKTGDLIRPMCFSWGELEVPPPPPKDEAETGVAVD